MHTDHTCSTVSDALPSDVVPKHYHLELTPDLDVFEFDGQVTVNVEVKNKTKTIVLHVLELELQKIVFEQNGNHVSPSSKSYDELLQQMTIVFDSELPLGEAVLKISFCGQHSNTMSGFYRSIYTDPGSTVEKKMVVTQFEPTAARQAFPCWDEPKLKATFDVILNVPENLTALSNMEVKSTRPCPEIKAGYKSVTFNRSLVMSTYLLAFAVGEFEYVSTTAVIETPGAAQASKSVDVRVYTTTGLKETGVFARDCAVKFLQYYSKVFKIPYMLPKMDMLAVHDFSAGAMENWGLVTYRTSTLLYYEGQSSDLAKQNIAYVVAHELAHQWFGNLVTMQDWSELWLNEGFATWVGWYAVDLAFPEWNVWTQFVHDDIARALELDGLASSHPIVVPVKRASEISQIFDAISYSKGASVIRMLGGWLKEEIFLEGVANYLKKHQYANATTMMLWDALSAHSGKDVASFMKNWTTCVGYPVLDVKIDAAQTALCVSQKIFQSQPQSAGDTTGAAKAKTIWCCPLGLANYDFMLNETESLFQVSPEFIKNGQVKINRDQYNFYRTRYSDDVLRMLGQCRELSETDRTGLADDAFALCRAGLLSTTAAIELLVAMRPYKRAYVMQEQIASNFSLLKAVFAPLDETFKKSLRGLIVAHFEPVLEEVGMDFSSKGEDHQTALLRGLAFKFCACNGSQHAVDYALKSFAKIKLDDTSSYPHANIRGAVYNVAVDQCPSREAFDKVRAIYENTKLAVDNRMAALMGMGASRDPALLRELLEYTMKDGGKVRAQDWIYSFRAVANNLAGREIVWNFCKNNWDKLEDAYRISLSMIGRFVQLADNWSDMVAAKTMIKDFFTTRDTKLFNRALEQTLEKIVCNSEWVKRDGDKLRDWLAKNVAQM